MLHEFAHVVRVNDIPWNSRTETAAARLLRRLVADDAGILTRLSEHSRIPIAQLLACHDGELRLAPVKQMQIAATVVTLAPKHERLAHALYAQAQAELRVSAGEVVARDHYAGPEAARGSAKAPPPLNIRFDDVWARSEPAIAREVDLRNANQRLRSEARALVALRRRLSAEDASSFRAKVERLSRILRESGAPQDRALVLVREAVEPLVGASGDGAAALLDRVADWLREVYDAA